MCCNADNNMNGQAYESGNINRVKESEYPENIIRLLNFEMHDQKINSIYLRDQNDLVMDIEIRFLGFISLVFTEASNVSFTYDTNLIWLYFCLKKIKSNRFKIDIEFDDCEVTFTFKDISIEDHTKPYINAILECCKTENDKSVCNKSNENLFYEISQCTHWKEHFLGFNSLKPIEKDIFLLHNYMCDLTCAIVTRNGKFQKLGCQRIFQDPKQKINRIISILKLTGSDDLYQFTLEAQKKLEETSEEEIYALIQQLDTSAESFYLKSKDKREKIHKSFINYIIANDDKF